MEMNVTDWFSCDGNGGASSPRHAGFDSPSSLLSRRRLFGLAGLGAISWLSSRSSALAQVALRPAPKESRHVLVVVFLRGGADGLNIVAPYREDAYYRLRPTVALAAPTDRGASDKDRLLDLNGFFGLHPAMSSALPLFREGALSFVHACGSFDGTHSHFDAMSTMERGLSTSGDGTSSGWLARHLNATSSPDTDSPLRAVAFGNVLPDSLRGAPGPVALESLSDFHLDVAPERREEIMEALVASYKSAPGLLAAPALGTLEAVKSLNRMDPNSYRPQNGAEYPKSDIAQGLKQVAMLVRGNVGLEVACLDKGGWDTHVAQGGSSGWQAGLVKDLGDALAAFAKDLGQDIGRVTTIVMTEFGRRAYENSGLGTDHGHASCMMLLGGNVQGGKILGEWPGLEEHQLEEPGDLKVTTDYRSVLARILESSLGNRNVGEVFPGFTGGQAGVLRS